jgi:hypothetical protein
MHGFRSRTGLLCAALLGVSLAGIGPDADAQGLCVMAGKVRIAATQSRGSGTYVPTFAFHGSGVGCVGAAAAVTKSSVLAQGVTAVCKPGQPFGFQNPWLEVHQLGELGTHLLAHYWHVETLTPRGIAGTVYNAEYNHYQDYYRPGGRVLGRFVMTYALAQTDFDKECSRRTHGVQTMGPVGAQAIDVARP